MRNFRYACFAAFADVWAISAAACDAFPCVLVVIQHPIVEGGPPSSIEAFEPVVERVAALLVSGDSVLCHCRGGVGRAGLLASCVLLGTGVSNSPCDAITLVRKRRHVALVLYLRFWYPALLQPCSSITHSRCATAVETRIQEDFVAKFYSRWVQKQPSQAQPAGSAPQISAD
jgi:hypothetical protein